MIVMYRRRFEAYTLAQNVWLLGRESVLREHAAQLGYRFEIRILPEDDEA
jgi:hypothetical protein